ncbi:hypothetical protein I5677_16675 [Mobilitalea sibirica]|uniref:Uncharacterized protein n=1 Tax=Mobilitalea sibirica TaxID=1462919 RepID=A0A8J7HEJ9_9FIRM|nr:hypothetical protein [Mobilitalea sibirica]MBH1942529.1 hypothetical protein [Mobilitalea sibirica]
MREFAVLFFLIVLFFTIIVLIAISKGQAINKLKISVPNMLEIEADMDKRKEKADVASTGFDQKKKPHKKYGN